MPDISRLNWNKLKEAGVSHIIFDKDNCITKPLEDTIVPDIQPSWNQSVNLGFTTILIVSNSAGSSNDPLGIGAEHLSRTLGQLVLAHPSKKPSNACAKQILDFLSLRYQDEPPSSGHIMVIGDRITTDIILASRIQRLLWRKGDTKRQAIGVLTTKIHAPERLGTRFMRGLEMHILDRLIRVGITPGSNWRKSSRSLQTLPMDWQAIATGMEIMSSTPAMKEIVKQHEDLTAAPPLPPLKQRLKDVPSKITGYIVLAGSRSLSWLSAGWHLINDGIHLGTKGYIGSPDPAQRRTRLNINEQTKSKGFYLSSSITSLPPVRNTLRISPPNSRSFASRHRPKPPPPPPPSPPRKNTLPPRVSSPSLHQRGRLRGWSGAIAALILVPTCWYGGVILHEWMDVQKEEEIERKEDRSGAATTFQPNRSNSAAPSLASSQQDQALLTVRHHLQHELREIDEKLLRLEERTKEKMARV